MVRPQNSQMVSNKTDHLSPIQPSGNDLLTRELDIKRQLNKDTDELATIGL